MKKKSYREIESVSMSLVEQAVERFGEPDYVLESAAGAFTGLDTEGDAETVALVASVVNAVEKLPTPKTST